jgi:serine/threonine protein kinase
VALKIASSGFTDEDATHHERNMSQFLETNPSHDGFGFVRVVLDSFEAVGPGGKHLCLVYEPMREPLWLFQQRMPNGKIPPRLLKVYLGFFLQALDYLHSECHIIHTGEFQIALNLSAKVSLCTILVGFEHPSVIKEYVQKLAENPMPRKIRDGRFTYLSHNDFGPLKSFRVLPKIADFGLAQPGDSLVPLRYPIQPPLFHAPEVLLGTGWTYSADIWNLGVLVYFHLYHTC